MPPAARVTDMHTCPMVTGLVPHVGGPILPPGHPTTMIGFLPAARIGDMVTCVGPPDTIIKGSPTVLIGNMPAARMGDNTAHGGVIVIGHPTTLIGDAGSGGGGGGGGGAPGAGSAPASSGPQSQSTAVANAQAAMIEAASVGAGLLADETLAEAAEDTQATFTVRVVEDATGDPVPEVTLNITLPNGETETHTTDTDGTIVIDDLEAPGTCTVSCNNQGARLANVYDFVGMGEAPLNPPRLESECESELEAPGSSRRVLEVEEHHVTTGESLESLAADAGLTWQDLALFNWGVSSRPEANEHLRHDVGCTQRDARGNYVFSDDDDPGVILIPRAFEQGDLATDQVHTIRVRAVAAAPRLLACVRIPGITFEFDKSFIRPSIVDEIQNLEDALRRFPYAKVAIWGHTDRVGGKQYNKDLSDRRAKSVYAFITDNADIWEELYNEERWGVRVIQEILTDLGHNPGPIDGKMGPKTRAGMRSFLGLPDDAPVENNADFRRRLFTAYMTGKHDVRLTDDRFFEPKHMGCGEYNPLVEPNENELARGGRGRAPGNEPNRRVVFYLFDRPPTSIPCAQGDISICEEQVAIDPQGRANPLRQCSFYDRLARMCRCESDPAVALIQRSTPTFYAPEEPGSSNYVPLHSVYAYVVHFQGETDTRERARLYRMREGKLCNVASNRPVPIDCNRDAFFYFSHRDDLLTLDQNRWLRRDGTGLPLIGPILVPCGPDARIDIDVWQQRDWAIVRGPQIDGVRPDGVRMAEWRDDYRPGRLLNLRSGGVGFFPYGNYRDKERQERWKGSGTLIDLVQFGSPRGDPMWIGTLTALPSDKAKLLLQHNFSGGSLSPTSYNEVAPTGDNQDFPGHHRYNQSLLSQLLAIGASDQSPSSVDRLPAPPDRCLLPGDICWLDQGQTNTCGPHSVAAAMNYWYPYTNNPARKSGAYYTQHVPDTVNGARTPDDIVGAMGNFNMNARDNDAEDLNQARGLKLIKLWIQAGVPVLILVKEEYNLWSYHWKTVVGYEGNRFFLNNSGADNEVVRSQRTPGIDYEHAPVGNDVESAQAFWGKWDAAGGDIVDAFTSVDECSFIPIYPKEGRFGGDAII